MKCEMTDAGTLIIAPENGIETFALRKWDEAFVTTRYSASIDGTEHIVRGSGLILILEVNNANL